MVCKLLIEIRERKIVRARIYGLGTMHNTHVRLVLRSVARFSMEKYYSHVTVALDHSRQRYVSPIDYGHVILISEPK